MINITLMGGLGNQMFQYATLRAYMEKWNEEGTINLIGITGKTHNVFSLDHFNINSNVKFEKKKKIKQMLAKKIGNYYYKNHDKFSDKKNKLMSAVGIYAPTNKYFELSKSRIKNKQFYGYFQSAKYFENIHELLQKEFEVKDPVMDVNKKYYKDILNSNSVCLHIRRGDYVGTHFQVCTKEYYLKAIDLINQNIKNPVFFVFSDDIEWVRKNFNFKDNFIFIESKNPAYEELRLMYSCKHFIISNSSFSWWAQYLSKNKNKIVVAPNVWGNGNTDIFMDEWTIISPNENSEAGGK